MNDWSAESRPLKKVAREAVCGYFGRTYRSALWLPGLDLADVSLALANKAIDGATHNWFVEACGDTSALMEWRAWAVTKKGLCIERILAFKRKLHHYNLLPKEIREAGLNGLEFGFFDFTGQITYDLAQWFRRMDNDDLWSSDCRLSFTVCLHSRWKRWADAYASRIGELKAVRELLLLFGGAQEATSRAVQNQIGLVLCCLANRVWRVSFYLIYKDSRYSMACFTLVCVGERAARERNTMLKALEQAFREYRASSYNSDALF